MPLAGRGGCVNQEGDVDDLAADRLEGPRPSFATTSHVTCRSNRMRRALYEPRNSQFCGVTRAVEPPGGAKLQAAFDEGGRQVGLGGGVYVGEVVAQLLGLLASGQIRDIGGDKRELARHQRGRLRDPLGRDADGGAVRVGLGLGSLQGAFERPPDRVEAWDEDGLGHDAGVDQRAEGRGAAEQVVEPKPIPAPKCLSPLAISIQSSFDPTTPWPEQAMFSGGSGR